MIDRIVKGLKALVGLGAIGFALSACADTVGTAKWDAMQTQYQIGFPKVVVADGVSIENFPMPVRLGNANGFSITEIAENQIRFFVAETGGGYKEVPFEVECWEVDTDRALVWVKIPSVVTNQKIYMGVMAEGRDDDLLPKTDVWADYYAVWHMNDKNVNTKDTTSGGITDSTVYGRDGAITKVKNSDIVPVVTGLGKGVEFRTYSMQSAYSVAKDKIKDLMTVDLDIPQFLKAENDETPITIG